jgi:hypothetical protein
MIRLPQIGDLITIKMSSNPYISTNKRLKVVSFGNYIHEEPTVINVLYRGSPYIVHVTNVKTITPAQETVKFS